MTKQEFKDKLEDNGLGSWFGQLESELGNTIRLGLTEKENDDVPIGTSKIGGCPDLPQEISWASETKIEAGKVETRPLSFIAQINLAEAKPYDVDDLLPSSGRLYFFYSAEQEAWGHDYKDKDSFKVFYFEGENSELMRSEFPADLPDYGRYKACAVAFRQEISLADSVRDKIQDYFLEKDDEDKFLDVFCESENVNKLLGYADYIQSEMELECELVMNKLDGIDPPSLRRWRWWQRRAKRLELEKWEAWNLEYERRKVELEPKVKEWKLLLQIDSNEQNGMMWGDAGRIYFWIKKNDLLDKQFEKAWFIFQCF